MKKYAVLLNTIEGVDSSKLSHVAAKARKVPLFDVSKRMRGLTGTVEENLDEATAQDLVLQLRNNGIRSFAIEMAKMIMLPSPTGVRNGRVTNEFLHLEANAMPGGREKWDIKWDAIVLLACARVSRKEIIQRMETEQQVRFSGRGVHVRTVPVMKKVSRGKLVNLLDIFSSEPNRLFRIEAESFNFSSLGLVRLMPTHYQNLVQFITILANQATKASIDASIKFILDGNPATNLKTPNLTNYEAHVRWALQLALLSHHRQSMS